MEFHALLKMEGSLRILGGLAEVLYDGIITGLSIETARLEGPRFKQWENDKWEKKVDNTTYLLYSISRTCAYGFTDM